MLSHFSCVRLFVILWTVSVRLLLPWDSAGKNTEVGCHALLQGIFPTQGSNPRLLWLLHCRRILYCRATGAAHSPPTPGEQSSRKFYQYTVSPYLSDKIRTFFLEVTLITHLPLKKDLIFIVWLTNSEIINLATYHFRNKDERVESWASMKKSSCLCLHP